MIIANNALPFSAFVHFNYILSCVIALNPMLRSSNILGSYCDSTLATFKKLHFGSLFVQTIYFG